MTTPAPRLYKCLVCDGQDGGAASMERYECRATSVLRLPTNGGFMKMKPEPLLEMTESEKRWVRRIFDYPAEMDYLTVARELRNILLRVEAGRRRALEELEWREYEVQNLMGNNPPRPKSPMFKTNADRLAEVEREVKGG